MAPLLSPPAPQTPGFATPIEGALGFSCSRLHVGWLSPPLFSPGFPMSFYVGDFSSLGFPWFPSHICIASWIVPDATPPLFNFSTYNICWPQKGFEPDSLASSSVSCISSLANGTPSEYLSKDRGYSLQRAEISTDAIHREADHLATIFKKEKVGFIYHTMNCSSYLTKQFPTFDCNEFYNLCLMPYIN